MHKGINTTADEGQTPIIQHGGGFDDAQVAHSLRPEGFDASEDGTGRGTPIVPVQQPFSIVAGGPVGGNQGGDFIASTIAFSAKDSGAMPEGPHDTANIRAASGGSSRSYVAQTWGVRRLTPKECARLQGFPDDWAMIPWRGKPTEECPDGPQYRAYGNSMAVNCMVWIGERLHAVASAGEG